MKAIASAPGAILKTLVTGAHLAESSGSTWREIAADGLPIDESVEVLLDSGTDESIATSIGLGVMRYAQAIKRLDPDILVILGDRFEAIAAAVAATVCKVPIAHIHGGELTLGAMDDAFRHAITKMSHVHFTSTESYRCRVIQLGEDPARVHNVGALGVENALTLPLLERPEVERRLNLPAGTRYFLVTFHPATLDPHPPEAQLQALLEALEAFPSHAIVFTGANADAGGTGLNRMLAEYVRNNSDRYRFSMSLGTRLYLSAARESEAVIGNSSSGIIEVPSFGRPTVDIGIRQLGRIRSDSVLTCEAQTRAIRAAIAEAISPEFRTRAATAINPYQQPATTTRIVEILMTCDVASVQQKNFYDIQRNAPSEPM